MLIGLLINFIGFDPIKMLIYSAVANGLVAPVIIFFIVHMSSSKKIVKERINSPFTAALGWYIMGIMTISGAATIVSLFL